MSRISARFLPRFLPRLLLKISYQNMSGIHPGDCGSRYVDGYSFIHPDISIQLSKNTPFTSSSKVSHFPFSKGTDWHFLSVSFKCVCYQHVIYKNTQKGTGTELFKIQNIFLKKICSIQKYF